MKLRFLFYLPCLLLNCGCFQSADRSKAGVISSPSLQDVSSRALSSPYFEVESQKDAKWWKMFESPELDGLIEEAIVNSPTLQQAEAMIVAAQAGAKSVRSKLFPQLGVNATDNWAYLSKYGFFRDFFPLPPTDVIPSKYNEIDLSLNFSYEIDFWGKNRKSLARALGLAMAQEMEKEQAKLVLCEAVAFSYFEWQSHTAQKLVYEKWLVSAQRLLHFFSSRSEGGIDDTIPPLVQNQSLGEIEQKIIELDKQRAIDLFFLNNLLGKGPDAPLSLQFVPEHLSQKIQLPENLGLDLLAQRPDLMSQIWRVSAAAEAIGVAKTEFYPNVNLAALAGLSSLTFSHFFQWASRVGSLTPAIHLPLFTGWQLEANLEEKVALFNQEVYSYNTMLLKAAEQVATEITTFLALTKQLDIQRSLVDLQSKAYQIAALRTQKGIDDDRPSLAAFQNLLLQELAAICLSHSQILSTLLIIQSLGGGMQPQKYPSSLNR